MRRIRITESKLNAIIKNVVRNLKEQEDPEDGYLRRKREFERNQSKDMYEDYDDMDYHNDDMDYHNDDMDYYNDDMADYNDDNEYYNDGMGDDDDYYPETSGRGIDNINDAWRNVTSRSTGYGRNSSMMNESRSRRYSSTNGRNLKRRR